LAFNEGVDRGQQEHKKLLGSVLVELAWKSIAARGFACDELLHDTHEGVIVQWSSQQRGSA
jgi:hypothetical protein